MSRSLLNLIARIEDSNSADVSLKDVRVLAKSHDPEVIPALAGLLDNDGRIGREAVRALRSFGRVAEPTLRRCLDSHDELARAHAEELLAALGEAPEADAPELAAPESGNDNEEEVDTAPLTDPEVTRSVKATLYARGVPRQEIDDGVAEVQMRVLETLRVGPGPDGLSEWRALANRVATAFAADEARKRKVKAKRGDELCEEPDAFVLTHERDYDPIDAKRLFRIFKGMAEGGELPPLAADIAEARMGGLTDAEIGEELGLTRAVVFKRRGVTRARFVAKLLSLGMSELIPRAMEREKDGEAVERDDLPDSLLRG